VLLKNDQLLPLGERATQLGRGLAQLSSILFLGPDALLPSTQVKKARIPSGLGDRGSSNTVPPYVISFFEGVQARAPKGVRVFTSQDVSQASLADVVIIPVSLAHEDEGEAYDGGQDRENLSLSGPHPKHWTNSKPSQFIAQAAALNKNVIVLLMVGGAVVLDDWMEQAKVIIQTFYPGQEAGHALARLLFGDLNFSGKLPFTVAQKEADYPDFQNKASQMHYDYFHGYRKFEKQALTPRFWFGYGLSYTQFKYRDLKRLSPSSMGEKDALKVEVTVANSGKMQGEEVVQLYVAYPSTQVRRPFKELKAFRRVALAPGESAKVELSVPVKDLAYWGAKGWTLEKTEHLVQVGPSADPASLLSQSFRLH
jgi:beta-glucosidase